MSEMNSITGLMEVDSHRLAIVREVAVYLVAIATLFPVLPWLYHLGTAYGFHFLTHSSQRGPSWRVDLFKFFATGWWAPVLGLILASLGLATLSLLASRRSRAKGSRIALATKRMALAGIALGLLGFLLLAELLRERFLV